MAEYIDKAQVQTELMMNAERYTIAHESGGFGTVEWSDNLIPVSKAMEIIRNMPSIEDVTVVHGKWLYGEDFVAMCDGYRCDKCGYFVPWDYEHKFISFIEEYKYCPNCGSRNRGENEE